MNKLKAVPFPVSLPDAITELKHLRTNHRAWLKKKHRGFLKQVATETGYKFSKVSEHFNLRNQWRCQPLETALVARINQLISADRAERDTKKNDPISQKTVREKRGPGQARSTQTTNSARRKEA